MMKCPVCAHSLDALRDGRCPECGVLLRLTPAKGQQLTFGPRGSAFLLLLLAALLTCVAALFVGVEAANSAAFRDSAALGKVESKYLEREFAWIVAQHAPPGSAERDSPKLHERISVPSRSGVTPKDWRSSILGGGIAIAAFGLTCIMLLHASLAIFIRRAAPAGLEPRKFSRRILIWTTVVVGLAVIWTAALLTEIAKT